MAGRTADDVARDAPSQLGRVCIVTGANTGIGKEAARVLAKLGATVFLACRDAAKADAARASIVASCGGKADVHCLPLDLSSFSSIHRFAEAFLSTGLPLHILLNNAGFMTATRGLTADGFESHFGVNYLGPFLLTHLLLPRLRSSAPSRIINVASDIYTASRLDINDLQLEKNFDGLRGYANSKLMNILFTRELAARLEGTRVGVCSVHPGVVDSDFMRESGRESAFAIAKAVDVPVYTVEQGAATLVYACTSADPDLLAGYHFKDCTRQAFGRKAENPGLQKELWDVSVKLAGVQPIITSRM